MEWKQNFISNPKFDVHNLLMLLFKFEEEGYFTRDITHLGNNEFELHLEAFGGGFLSGHGFSGHYKLEGDKIIEIKEGSSWMR